MKKISPQKAAPGANASATLAIQSSQIEDPFEHQAQIQYEKDRKEVL